MTLKEILLSNEVVKTIGSNLNFIKKEIPEIEYMIGYNQKHPHHHLDLWNHTLYALSISPKDYEIRLALLLHDIGKPFSYQEIDNIRHYKNHAIKSYEISKKILDRLDLDVYSKENILYLIKEHDTPLHKNDNYKKYIIQFCDALAHNPDKLEKRIDYLEKNLYYLPLNEVSNYKKTLNLYKK